MIEYPSIANSSKAPRKHCIAFDKLDGSNFRAKYTNKNGFCLYGTRTQLINENTPFWNDMINAFLPIKPILEEKFKKDKEYRNYREIIVYGEYFGDSSFAGNHNPNEKKKIVIFDILLDHKQRKFVKPQTFVKEFGKIIEIPRIVYEGNLSEEFIKQIREDKYNTPEGVICKGTETSGAYMGGIWMCKIKTQKYLDSLKTRFGDEWTKYAE